MAIELDGWTGCLQRYRQAQRERGTSKPEGNGGESFMHFIFLLIIFTAYFEADVDGHPYEKCRRLIDGINKRSQLSLSVEGGPTFCASSAELLCMAEDGGQITFKLCNSTRGESGECTFDCIVAMYIELKCMIVCAVQMEENVGGGTG